MPNERVTLSVLVTGDADLLELDVDDLAIVSPAEFLRRLPPHGS